MDDTAGIQYLRLDYDSKQAKYVFIKVATTTPLSSPKSMEIHISDDAHISTEQLFFRQSHTFTNVKPSEVKQMTFRASHTPATL